MAVLKRKISKLDRAEVVNSYEQVKHPSQLLDLLKAKDLCSFPLDLEKILYVLNIRLRYQPMDSEKSGYIRRDGNGWLIGVNSLHHPKRQKFTIAHELGHYFLHRSRCESFEDTVLFRASGFGDTGEEWEANEFAAGLLMPENKFKEFVAKLHGDVKAISDCFGVSSLAVSYRAKELGY